MDSRTWLAIALSIGVLFVYSKWFTPPPPPVSAPQAQTQTQNPSAEVPPAVVPAAQIAKRTADISGVALPFETAFVSGKISKSSGTIVELSSKKYREDLKKPDSPFITIFSANKDVHSLWPTFSDPQLQNLFNKTAESKTNALDFKKAEANGFAISSSYKVTPQQGVFEWELTLKKPAGLEKKDLGMLTLALGGQDLAFDVNSPLSTWEGVIFQNDSVTRHTIDQVEKGSKVTQGSTGWVAFGNRYFTTALLPNGGLNPDAVLLNEGGFVGTALRYPLQFKDGQSELKIPLKVYSGPKDVAALSEVASLKQLIDFGFFSVFAYPLLEIIHFFYKFVKNYGVAIILLTLLVRALFYPLSLHSYRSMKNMQKLQPQLNALKEKYADDKARFGQEQLALFKEHKINPAGGCLPIMIQLPVFIALYAVLGNSIDLFQAPFYGWIHDLSAKDPYYILPVLMGISMFIQQLITPNPSMDATQQKIMYLMPIIFTFFMVNLPSGLTLYMFVSTLLGILQQWMMMREKEKDNIVDTVIIN